MGHCKYCPSPTVPYNEPPLCEKHLDLVVIVEFMLDNKQEVTAKTVQAQLRQCIANNGALEITEDDVPNLLAQVLPDLLAQRGKMEITR